MNNVKYAYIGMFGPAQVCSGLSSPLSSHALQRQGQRDRGTEGHWQRWTEDEELKADEVQQRQPQFVSRPEGMCVWLWILEVVVWTGGQSDNRRQWVLLFFWRLLLLLGADSTRLLCIGVWTGQLLFRRCWGRLLPGTLLWFVLGCFGVGLRLRDLSSALVLGLACWWNQLSQEHLAQALLSVLHQTRGFSALFSNCVTQSGSRKLQFGSGTKLLVSDGQ